MNAFRTHVRNKLLLLLICSLSLIVITVFHGFSSMDKVMNDYSNIVNVEATTMLQVAELNVEFKTQVQEWKNTLIRGSDPKQLEKYWGRFNLSVEKIKSIYSSMLQKIDQNHPARTHIKTFAEVYPNMVSAYRTGYADYINSGKNIAIADNSVKGIDRAPTESLTLAVEAVSKNIRDLKALSEQQTQESLIFTQISTLVVIALVLVAVSWFVNKNVISPLKRVTEESKKIASGDLTANIECSSQDEIGQVAKNFMLIQMGLSKVFAGIFTDIKGLGSIIERLSIAFEKMKNGVQGQTAETAKLTENMQNLSDSNESVNQAISDANTLVSECAELADSGQMMFKDNVLTSHNMLDAVNDASSIVATLKVNTDNIGNVVNVINGIAEQTNLLALNAAIEAARAGETGRGFAVVADEVRSLATKTQQSIQQISENIEKLQSAADTAVQAMSVGKDKAEESLSQTEKSQEFVNSIYQVINKISDLHGVVEAEMTQQLAQTNSIDSALAAIEKQCTQSEQEALVLDSASSELASIYKHIDISTKELKIRKIDSNSH
ncbi:methyl-accepting chemotaxis protein [Paraglaciecola aquimarina]|uniref:Methyl-accepting chemotaxis protein n=1 Tax=Paraglaciecola aquimarina TaxID=1235557 RepID=A0ABU3SUI8_9ALTE|nr:methyl-accepting chemotaxis protein [Paraglaciecola aquimarina]MDU0353658.1 methyl-accepting chemotaxis protein [Paraglaciecola aquimarina]